MCRPFKEFFEAVVWLTPVDTTEHFKTISRGALARGFLEKPDASAFRLMVLKCALITSLLRFRCPQDVHGSNISGPSDDYSRLTGRGTQRIDLSGLVSCFDYLTSKTNVTPNARGTRKLKQA